MPLPEWRKEADATPQTLPQFSARADELLGQLRGKPAPAEEAELQEELTRALPKGWLAKNPLDGVEGVGPEPWQNPLLRSRFKIRGDVRDRTPDL